MKGLSLMMGAILPEGQGERVVSNDGCYSS